MFNSGFYPTPEWLANRLVSPYVNNWERAYGRGPDRVLDSSAGKGDLLRAAKLSTIKDYSGEVRKETRRLLRATQFHAIEIEPELAASCVGQGFSLVGSDCLSFSPDVLYDHVFINPPFDSQEDHIIASWAFVQAGGTLDAIVSDKLLRKDTEKRRRVANLLDEYGSEPEWIGPAFKNAERKTNVNVLIIRLRKPVNSKNGIFEGVNFDPDIADIELNSPNELMKANKLEAIIDTYGAAKIHLQEFVKARQRLFNTLNVLKGKETCSFPKDLLDAVERGEPDEQYRHGIKYIQTTSWKELFHKMDFQKAMTKSIREEFSDMINGSTGLPFTEENIKRVFRGLVENMENIQQANVEKVFEEFRRYHKDNTEPWVGEGWKTNDAYRVKKKVILPGVVEIGWGGSFSWRWNAYRNGRELFHDIDLALKQVTGGEEKGLVTAMEEQFDKTRDGHRYDEFFYSDHFKIRMFKKGTIHLTFTDKFTWQEFCLAAAKGKGWLPE